MVDGGYQIKIGFDGLQWNLLGVFMGFKEIGKEI
jgi:hypothetical protein